MSFDTRTFRDTLQVASIHDPLASNGESGNVSVLVYNAILSEKFRAIIHQLAEKGNKKTLEQLTELHLCVMCLAALEGAGQLRFTEAVSALFSSPNPLARRTLFWENQRLTVGYDWTKVSDDRANGNCGPQADTDRAVGKPSNIVKKTNDGANVCHSHVPVICQVIPYLYLFRTDCVNSMNHVTNAADAP